MTRDFLKRQVPLLADIPCVEDLLGKGDVLLFLQDLEPCILSRLNPIVRLLLSNDLVLTMSLQVLPV